MKTTLLLFSLIAVLFVMSVNQSQASSTSQEKQIVFKQTHTKKTNPPIDELLYVTLFIGGVLGFREFKPE